jgi:hypothetical protein
MKRRWRSIDGRRIRVRRRGGLRNGGRRKTAGMDCPEGFEILKTVFVSSNVMFAEMDSGAAANEDWTAGKRIGGRHE